MKKEKFPGRRRDHWSRWMKYVGSQAKPSTPSSTNCRSPRCRNIRTTSPIWTVTRTRTINPSRRTRIALCPDTGIQQQKSSKASIRKYGLAQRTCHVRMKTVHDVLCDGTLRSPSTPTQKLENSVTTYKNRYNEKIASRRYPLDTR